MPHKDPEERKRYFKEYRRRNKEKLDKYRAEYASNNPAKEGKWREKYVSNSVEKRRSYTIKSRYGLSAEDYNSMLSSQGNRCAICNIEFVNRPHIDHDHTTGKVRALLCSPCNTGLGVYENKKDSFKRYLEIHNGASGNIPRHLETEVPT